MQSANAEIVRLRNETQKEGGSVVKRLIIAMKEPEIVAALTHLLRNHFEIRTVTSEEEALNVFGEFSPDYFVLELVMPGLDGLSLLQIMNTLGHTPVVVAMADFLSHYQQAELERLGVVHLLLSPMDAHVLAAHLTRIASYPADMLLPKPDRTEIISNFLSGLGLLRRHMGFSCLLIAIARISEEPEILYTKELYPDIAKEVGSSSVQVERGIRSAILHAWRNRNENLWKMFFECNIDAQEHPTNSEFINTIAYYTRRQVGNGINE